MAIYIEWPETVQVFERWEYRGGGVTEAVFREQVEYRRARWSNEEAPEALAAEDFSGAWVPDTFSDAERDLVRNGAQTTEKAVVQDDGGTVMEAAMTTQAIEQQRQREKLIERAKTEQDKQRARQESQVYRLSLIFSGEEAKTIKAVLGGFPAEKLLELCTQALAETEAAHELAAAVGVG